MVILDMLEKQAQYNGREGVQLVVFKDPLAQSVCRWILNDRQNACVDRLFKGFRCSRPVVLPYVVRVGISVGNVRLDESSLSFEGHCFVGTDNGLSAVYVKQLDARSKSRC